MQSSIRLANTGGLVLEYSKSNDKVTLSRSLSFESFPNLPGDDPFHVDSIQCIASIIVMCSTSTIELFLYRFLVYTWLIV